MTKQIRLKNSNVKNKVLYENKKKIAIEKKIKEYDDDIKEKTNIDELYRLFKISECNNKKKVKFIKNIYDSKYINHNFYETINYKCNLKTCLSCKRQKASSYISNRMITEKKLLYFITLSSDYEINDLNKFEKEVIQLRQKVRNVFSLLKIPFFSSLEKGEKGNKIHLHILCFQDDDQEKISSVYLVNFLRATTGFYTYSEIVKTDNQEKLKSYIFKMIGYSTKFIKDIDDVSTDNFIKLTENNYNLIKNINIENMRELIKEVKYNEKELLKLIGTSNKKSEVLTRFNNVLKYYKRNIIINFGDKDIFFIVLSLSFTANANIFLNGIVDIRKSVLSDIKEKKIKKYNIENELSIRVFEFLKRFLKGVKTKFNYNIELLENLQKNSNFDDDNFRIYNKMFFSSDIKKRILSNISIFETRKIKIVDDLTVNFKEHKESNKYKGFDINNIKASDYYLEKENDLNLKFRKYRILQENDLSIYKENFLKENKVKNDNKIFYKIIGDSLKRIIENKYKKNTRIKSSFQNYLENNKYYIILQNRINNAIKKDYEKKVSTYKKEIDYDTFYKKEIKSYYK